MVVNNYLGKVIELFLFYTHFGFSVVFHSVLPWFSKHAWISDLISPSLQSYCVFLNVVFLQKLHFFSSFNVVFPILLHLEVLLLYRDQHVHHQCPTTNVLLPQSPQVKVPLSNQSLTQHDPEVVCGTLFLLLKQTMCGNYTGIDTAQQAVLLNGFSRSKATFRRLWNVAYQQSRMISNHAWAYVKKKNPEIRFISEF